VNTKIILWYTIFINVYWQHSMSEKEIELNPVTHVTTDAVGKPGKRVFYLQGFQKDRVITILVEKVQVQTLAIGVEQFLTEISSRHPDLPEASSEYDEEKMHIHPPVDPLFRAGEIGLAYEEKNDFVILIIREILSEEDKSHEDERMVVRFFCTRSQVHAMSQWGLEVASRGRPICPYCGEPMEPEGHFCPKKNGHKH